MRKLSQNIRQQSVKLFLQGFTYDDISWKLRIAKGSVVNIIDEFREGKLSLPENMTDYVDELRHVAVDLKKHEVTVGQMRSFLRIHKRLNELGENDEGIEELLNIIREDEIENLYRDY
ncbi:MAG: hypothetical protein PVJ08_07395 [Dehalococcoidia bacterium]|jgi:hypothetical protein